MDRNRQVNPYEIFILSKCLLPHQATRNMAATWELGKAAPGFSPLV